MDSCNCRRSSDVRRIDGSTDSSGNSAAQSARRVASRLEHAPEEHAEAVLAAYEVLQELHDRGVLEIMRGALAASDEILETVVDNVKTPEAIRAIRNLLFWRQILGSIEPDGSKASFRQFPKALPRQQRSGTNQSAFSDCYDGSPAKTVSAAWPQPLISCRPLGVTCNRRKIRFRAINRL